MSSGLSTVSRCSFSPGHMHTWVQLLEPITRLCHAHHRPVESLTSMESWVTCSSTAFIHVPTARWTSHTSPFPRAIWANSSRVPLRVFRRPDAAQDAAMVGQRIRFIAALATLKRHFVVASSYQLVVRMVSRRGELAIGWLQHSRRAMSGNLDQGVGFELSNHCHPAPPLGDAPAAHGPSLVVV